MTLSARLGHFLSQNAGWALACGGAGAGCGGIVGCWVARLNHIPIASWEGFILAATIAVVYGLLVLTLVLLGWAGARLSLLVLRGTLPSSSLRRGLMVGAISGLLLLLLRSHLAYGRPRSSVSILAALAGSALLAGLAMFAPQALRRVVTYGSVIPAVLLFAAISTEPRGEAKQAPAVRVLDRALTQPSDPGGPTRRKILLVGFDGLDPVTLQSLMARAELPTFSGLRRDGTYARSKTLTPTASPIIWSTIATGKQPEKHGIFGFVNHTFPGVRRLIARYPEGVGYQRMTSLFTTLGLSKPTPPTRDELTTNAIWDLVSAEGGRVAAVNWWVSWPAEKVNGVIVSDRFYSFFERRATAQEARGATYPPRLYDRLLGSIDPGRSQLLADLDEGEQETLFGGVQGRSDRALLEWALALDDTSMSVAREVLKEGPYDLMAVYLRGVDIVSHGYSNQVGPRAKDLYRRKLLEGYYRQADRQLATLVAWADRETDILVCSDHGFETQPDGTYGHRDAPDGVFLLGGPDVAAGKEIARIRMADLTPTMLYLLGRPVGEDMDGRVLAEALRPELMASRPVEYVGSYDARPRAAHLQNSSIDDEAYEGLKALGYVK